MPAVMEYPTKATDVDKLVEKEKRARQALLASLWQYYKGEHKKPLKVSTGQPDDNVIINLSKILVDRGISTLFGRGVDFQLDEMAERNEPEMYLDAVWNGGQKQSNRKQLQLNDLGLNGFVTGQPAVKILPPPDEGGLVRIINLDPSIVFAFWRSDDIDNILWYSLYWSEDSRQDIVKQENGQWLIRDLIRTEMRKNAGEAEWQWKVINEEIWPHVWAPILTWKNLPNPNEFYGVSDIDHADLNDKINFIASNTNRILQRHAHPRTIVRGATLGEIIKDTVGGILAISKPPSDVAVDNLEMQSDLQSSMQYLEELKATFFSLGASVDMSTMKDKIGQITNFGLRVLFKDALDRLILKRALYGEALIEMNRRILELGGFGPDNETELVWPNALPQNPLEDVELVERQRNLGVLSKETAATKLGLDFEQELERMQAEAGTQDVGTVILENLAFNRGQNGL